MKSFEIRVREKFFEIEKKLKNNVYPVGSIYMSVNSTNPAELFGGAWVRIENTLGEAIYMWKRTA